MPVTLYAIDLANWEADAQVKDDLARIYKDAPPERLPARVDDFIRQHLDVGNFFFGARLNDHLLGAVAIAEDTEAWWLSHLCVRKTTRRRGVGSRLLALVSRQALAEGRQLRAPASQLPVADQMLLSRLGYRLTKAGDYFELNLPTQGHES